MEYESFVKVEQIQVRQFYTPNKKENLKCNS